MQGGNLPRIKIQNQSSIRKMIYMHGPILRSEIAETLGLTVPTITTTVNSLIELGVIDNVKDSSLSSNTLGRKAWPIDIVPDSRYFIGLEMRRTFRHLCIVNYRGQIIFSSSDRTVYPDYEHNVKSVGLLLKSCLQNLPVPLDKIAGVGVSAPGIIDSDHGVLQAHRKYNWYEKNIIKDIAEISGYKGSMVAGNNAYARALSQQLFHRETIRGFSSFVYLFISSGIACPFILCDPNTLSTAIGPGELGYMILQPAAYGGTEPASTLSDLSGERAMIEQCSALVNEGKAPYLASLCKDEIPTLSQILEAQEFGEESIDFVVNSAIYHLAISLASIDNFIRPNALLADAHIFQCKRNQDTFIKTINEYVFRPQSTVPNIIFIDHNEFSGALGGAALAIKKDFEQYLSTEVSL
jgi:N-acetylglucosamine repressor